MYTPGPIPTNDNNLREMIRFLKTELDKISEETKNGQLLSTTLIEHHLLPNKPQEGMLMRFAANIVAPATAQGVYEYVGGAWVKL